MIIMEKDIKTKAPHKSVQDIRSEHQGRSADKPHDRSDAEIHQVLHDDVPSVLGSGKTGFAHGESCLHPEDERRADQKPYCKYFTADCL